MTERQGIEIDYCPECRGVWLDRGELDKIIERAGATATPPPAVGKEPVYPSAQPLGNHPVRGDFPPSSPERYGHGQTPPYKKKKSMLSELFDFD
jgi:Zn-finger nucleic acid-binding protein